MTLTIDGVAAVTGAGQGIGLGVTRAFADRGVGVLALVLDEAQRDIVEAATSSASGSVRVEVVDVTDPGDFSFPDDLQILVNNAGIRLAYHSVEFTELEEWRRTFEVNLFGLVEMTRRAIPVLRARRSGVICNVSSGALLSSQPFQSAYKASKAAVSSLCETLRIELAPFGIRIVEIMPGPTASAMNLDSLLHRIADAASTEPYRPMAEVQRQLMAHVPPAASIDDVGATIVNAIFDDAGPLRYGTDELSNTMLAAWQVTGDEQLMAQTRAHFAGVIDP
jgi:NAD(P)-dependent dehydrogenase (short-subunit alcohol dehydrogenase family)